MKRPYKEKVCVVGIRESVYNMLQDMKKTQGVNIVDLVSKSTQKELQRRARVLEALEQDPDFDVSL